MLTLQGRRQQGGWGGAIAPPVFGRSVNPISTRGDTSSPPSTTSPPGFSDLAMALLPRYYLKGLRLTYSQPLTYKYELAGRLVLGGVN